MMLQSGRMGRMGSSHHRPREPPAPALPVAAGRTGWVSQQQRQAIEGTISPIGAAASYTVNRPRPHAPALLTSMPSATLRHCPACRARMAADDWSRGEWTTRCAALRLLLVSAGQFTLSGVCWPSTAGFCPAESRPKQANILELAILSAGGLLLPVVQGA